ncbi:MAG: hypothetical protein MI922_06625 [Bacteroidales bacterium]|nr:hypothetical protein [Bacteroidales bacterium]
MSYKKIKIDGKAIKSEKDFVHGLTHFLGIQGEGLTLISELKHYLSVSDDKIEITWSNYYESEQLMVRKSDVPVEELPKSGSLMQRDVILDLIWEKQSLADKAMELFKTMENVKILKD